MHRSLKIFFCNMPMRKPTEVHLFYKYYPLCDKTRYRLNTHKLHS